MPLLFKRWGDCRRAAPPKEEERKLLSDVDLFFRENTGRWAPSTQRLYARLLRRVCEWLEAIGVSYSSQVTTELLSQWLDDHDWGSSSRRNALNALRVFFRWAAGERSPAARIRFPKRAPAPIRRALDTQEALALLATPDTSTIKGKRDLAILVLMLDTGLRASELCNALLTNLNLRKKEIKVFVKGGKWGWAVFSSYTAQVLLDWICVRNSESPHIFVSIGGPKIGTRISPRGLWFIIDTLSRRAGIGHICPHELRHSFAVLSLRAGASTRTVQVAGRWRDLRMVEHYSQRLEMDAIRPHLPMNFLMN